MHFHVMMFAAWLAADGLAATSVDPGFKLDWVNPARCYAPCTYRPDNLVSMNERAIPNAHGEHQAEAAVVPALGRLIADAAAAGHALGVKSAFRRYKTQAVTHAKFGKEPGRAARPGHSEHQNGRTFDLTIPSAAAIAWLEQNAYLYGFAFSYPAHKQRVTGYRSELWHLRFVGLVLAAELHDQGLTLEEWFRAHPEHGESGDCHDCPFPESRAPCGSVRAEGTCRGHVMAWCYDGALAMVDCSLSGETCARETESGNVNCRAK